MDRNEKQNSFRNTRRTRGESKSIQKLKRRLRLTTVFAVVMLAAFLGSLAWLKISNDASKKTIDEQRREIAILNDDIKKMKDQEKEKEAAEVPAEETSVEETDKVPEGGAPEEENDDSTAIDAEDNEVNQADDTAGEAESTDEAAEEIDRPDEAAGEKDRPNEAAEEIDRPDEAAGEKDRTDEAAEEVDSTDNVAGEAEPMDEATEKADLPDEATEEENLAGKDAAAEEGAVALGDNEVSTQEADGTEDKQIRNREYIFQDIEKLLNDAQVSYEFACDIMFPDTLDNKVCFRAGQLEDKESGTLQNLILLSAYEKQLREIGQDRLYDNYGIESDYDDYVLVLCILGREDTEGEGKYATYVEPEEAKRLLIGRMGYIEYLRTISGGQLPIYSDKNDEQYKVVEENLSSGDWNTYSEENADEYIDYGYEYIQNYLQDVRYLGEAVCDETQAKTYYSKDEGFPFRPEIGMSLMEHLNMSKDNEGELWRRGRKQFLKERLKASYSNKKSTGRLIQKMKEQKNDLLWWIEDTENEDGENMHSYVYMMFPCHDGDQWCVNALFIDGGELSEETADKYCTLLLELAKAPTEAQTDPDRSDG